MRYPSFFAPRPAGVALLLLLSIFLSAPPATAQEADKSKQQEEAKVSEGEAKLAQKIQSAADAAARLQAAEEFIKKYPKSSLRPQVAEYLAGQIMDVKEPAQKIALAERYMTLFPEPSEGIYIVPALIETYAAEQRFDDAFRVGAAWLAKNPDDARVLSILGFHGINLARQNNPKYQQQSQPYLVKAVQLFEAGTKPAGVTDEQFAKLKSSWLPQLYQLQAVVAVTSGDTAGAAERAQKAAALNASDPMNYYIIGVAKNEDYQKMAAQYQSMTDGPQKTELRGKIDAQLDEIVDLYARVVALTADAPQHKALHDQVLTDMTNYYKFRHNGSTDGMQALIDKYKKQ